MQQQVFPQYETEVIEPVGDEDTSEGVNGARKSGVGGVLPLPSNGARKIAVS